jgi:glycosyltransferase involved in cell wall biosynthesis
MRVLYLQAGNLYGGVESTLVTMARYRHLSPEMEPSFAVCFEGRLSGELKTAGVDVSVLGDVRIRQPLSVLKARRALRRLMQSERFDVVMVTSAWLQAIFGPIVKAAGLPLVYWFHEPMRGRHWLERWARMTMPELALCNSQFTASTIRNMYPTLKTKVFYNPVCQSEAPPLSNLERAAVRAELKTPEDAVVIIQLSRMVEMKGHAQHLLALSHLKDLPGWVCWIVGAGQRPNEVRYFEELKRTVAQLGLNHRVFLTGERAGEAQRLLASADIYCQPNTSPDSFGNVFVEALSLGLPVVTTNIGGAKEIVTPACGLLIAPRQPEILAESLRRLIKDETLRAQLGAAGKIRAGELCDVTRQLKQLAGILGDVCLRPNDYAAVVEARLRIDNG